MTRQSPLCLVPGDPEDPRLRFRIWTGGQLADEVWIDTSSPGAQHHVDHAKRKHNQIARAADDAGELWLVEIYNPSAPPGRAYLRFGTDEADVVEPILTWLDDG